MRVFVLAITLFLLPTLKVIGLPDKLIPTASFSATTVCQGLPTVFTNNSTTLSGSIVANIWDFGDGEGSSVLNPKHVYANPGTFSVTLTVINTQGDVDDFTAQVTVHPSGTLDFLIASVNKCVSSTFTFTDLSNIPSGNFTSYTWDFGDGSAVDNHQNTTHRYANFGTYTLKLSTLTDHNCSNTASRQLEVFPEAVVDFAAPDVCMDVPMKFTNKTQVGSGLVTYLWDFNDTATSGEINPTHSYTTANSFMVKLQATTEKGCTTNTTKQVTVHPVPIADFIVSDHCFGSSALFDNQSSVASGTLTYTWNFSDGNFSNDEEPQHVYSTNGNYQVSLEAKSDKLCKASVTKHLVVSPKPIVNFSFKNICFGEKAEFFNNTTVAEGALTYNWDFGDSHTSASINPIHDFAVFGDYDVTLTATTPQGGCDDHITKRIKVNQQPVASFTAKNNCLDSLIVFKNTSVFAGADILYTWEFGDGKSVVVDAPTHQYTSAQTYSVSLKAQALNGCSNTSIQPVQVYPLPLVNFDIGDVCDTKAVLVKNFTSISSGTVRFVWDFGDAFTSTKTDPTHTYSSFGDYTVTATATSDAGCVSVKGRSVAVHPLPLPDFEAPAVCDSHPVVFKNNSVIGKGEIVAYSWDFGDQTNSIIKSPTKEFLRDGRYRIKLTAVSDFGCQKAIEKDVSVYPPPVARFRVNDVCVNEPVRVTNTSAISTGSLTYYWDFGDQSNSAAAAPSHEYKEYGVYTIRLIATSDIGCKDSVSHAVAIFSLPQVNAGEDQTVSKGYAAQLMAYGGSDYRWEPVESLDNSSIYNPVARPLSTTHYVVFVKDKYGCQNADTVTVSVIEDFKLVVSNVLTPDDNGKNDTWVIDNIETFGDAHVRVYNRWGKLVFEEEAYQNDWRGKAGGDILPDGTYYYYISFSESEKTYKGAITILRNKK